MLTLAITTVTTMTDYLQEIKETIMNYISSHNRDGAKYNHSGMTSLKKNVIQFFYTLIESFVIS